MLSGDGATQATAVGGATVRMFLRSLTVLNRGQHCDVFTLLPLGHPEQQVLKRPCPARVRAS